MIIATHTRVKTATAVQQIWNAVEFTAEKYEWLLPATEALEDISKLQSKHQIQNALYPQNMVLDILKAVKEYEYVFIPLEDRLIDILRNKFGQTVIFCYPEDCLRLYAYDKENCLNHIIVKQDETLSDKMEDIERIRKYYETGQISREAVEKLEEELKCKRDNLWLTYYTGWKSIYCKIDIENIENQRFIKQVAEILGEELGRFCRTKEDKDIQHSLEMDEEIRILDQDTFVAVILGIRKSFEEFRTHYENHKFMTFEYLSEIIQQYNIPQDVRLMSDSGWECDATDMNGVFYNEKENIIVFTQNSDDRGGGDDYRKSNGWELLSKKWEMRPTVFERIVKQTDEKGARNAEK